MVPPGLADAPTAICRVSLSVAAAAIWAADSLWEREEHR